MSLSCFAIESVSALLVSRRSPVSILLPLDMVVGVTAASLVVCSLLVPLGSPSSTTLVALTLIPSRTSWSCMSSTLTGVTLSPEAIAIISIAG